METIERVERENILKFHNEIERLKKSGLSTLEAFGEYCTLNQVEPEDILPLINVKHFSELKEDASERRLLKSEHRVNNLNSFI